MKPALAAPPRAVEVRLARGAHFQFGGVTIGGGEATREFVTRTVHAEPGATSAPGTRLPPASRTDYSAGSSAGSAPHSASSAAS